MTYHALLMTYHALLMTLTYDLLDLRRKPLIINDSR